MKLKMKAMENDTGILAREKIIGISREIDRHIAVVAAGKLVAAAGLDRIVQNRVATAVSELATNIYRYGKRGTIHIRVIEKAGKIGIEIIARDDGPGIEDVEKAMQEGFSTTKSLGIGLPGVRRLMDEFEIETAPGKGTRIVARKWGVKEKGRR